VAGPGGAAAQVPAWLACGEPDLPTSEQWLTPREAARAAGMRFTKRRTEYLVRRLAGKRAVAGVSGLGDDPTGLARIELANHPGGAPYVLVDRRPAGFDVSLTDRAGWAVCLVGPDLGRVGCDLELVEGRSEGFIADYLTPAEQAYVLERSGVDREVAANLLWSAKESALKVLRTGLRRDTRTVEVTVEPPESAEPGRRDGWGRLELRPVGGVPMAGWWRRDGRFLLTVAAASARPAPVLLPGSADLATAPPLHTWLDRPLAADGGE
jgi:4'-phosphopantetheinyl transferase